MKNIARIISAILLITFGVGIVITTKDIFKKFDYNELDFNNDGKVGLSDYLQAIDLDKRLVQRDGKICAEYYYLKDGMIFSTKCND